MVEYIFTLIGTSIRHDRCFAALAGLAFKNCHDAARSASAKYSCGEMSWEADALFIDTAFKAVPIRHEKAEIQRRVGTVVENRAQLAKYQQARHTGLQPQVSQFPSPQALVAAGQMARDINRLQQSIFEM